MIVYIQLICRRFKKKVESTYEYYRILSSFMANFNEAHTRIYTSKRPDDMPPIKAINFGEKIIVSDISQSIVNQIPVNSEILKINNIHFSVHQDSYLHLFQLLLHSGNLISQ